MKLPLEKAEETLEENVGFLGIGVAEKEGDGGKESGRFAVLEEKRGDEGEGVSS